MGFIEALNEATPKQSQYCQTGMLLRDQPDLADEIQTALDQHPKWSYETIATVLRDQGFEVPASSLGRHNGRRCKCPQPERT